jgi:hypothetical protein
MGALSSESDLFGKGENGVESSAKRADASPDDYRFA